MHTKKKGENWNDENHLFSFFFVEIEQTRKRKKNNNSFACLLFSFSFYSRVLIESFQCVAIVMCHPDKMIASWRRTTNKMTSFQSFYWRIGTRFASEPKRKWNDKKHKFVQINRINSTNINYDQKHTLIIRNYFRDQFCYNNGISAWFDCDIEHFSFW